MQEKQGVKTLVQGSGCCNPDMQEKQGVKTLMQGWGCQNLDMHEKMNAWWRQCWLCFVLWLFYASMSQLFHLQSSNSYLFSMFHKSEECHIYRGLTSKMSISLTFSFMILVHACLNSQVSESYKCLGRVWRRLR